ncbi:MAG: site-2 protease family protein [Lachnospiraceae bacterium]|nr:site-2 protease family protein [Lachnospiraceae bacterium]
MLSLLVSILALGAIIAFHEFGHFSIARLFGVGVIEYAVGMGPRIWSTIKGNTRYSLRAIPFGGFCMMLSEDLAEPEPDEEEAEGSRQDNVLGDRDPEVVVTENGIIYEGRFFSKEEQFALKPAWQRFLVILAGPVFNFFLAFVLALIITGYNGYDRPAVREVDPDMPVAEAGIEAGDLITALAAGDASVRPERIETARDIMLFMSIHQEVMDRGGMFTIYYQDKDDGIEKHAELVPVYDEELKRNRLGFSYSGVYEKADTLGEILYYSWYNVKFNFRTSLESIRMLLSGRASTSDLMGPIRMVATMDESVDSAASHGFVAALMTLFNLMILISSSLGFMNLLPLPALDGGRLLFILIEMVTRRKVPKELESRIHMIGTMMLLALMMFILFNDIIMLYLGR